MLFAILAGLRYCAKDSISIIYDDDCNLVRWWDTGLHFLINVLGTCLLAASSFTMQYLDSPTRSEVDAAHAKRRPMDIGIPSFSNFFYMHRYKGVLWWCLSLSTLPLRVLYNSIVFSTLGANYFSYMVVTPEFLDGANCTSPDMASCTGYTRFEENRTPSPQQFLAKYNEGNLTKLTPAQCIAAYSSNYIAGHRHFLAVSNTSSTSTRLSPGCAFAPYWSVNITYYYGIGANALPNWPAAEFGYPQPPGNGSSVLAYESKVRNEDLDWLCAGYVQDSGVPPDKNCDLAEAKKHYSENGTFYLRPGDTAEIWWNFMQSYPIDYCLSETKNVDRCQLQYVSYIL